MRVRNLQEKKKQLAMVTLSEYTRRKMTKVNSLLSYAKSRIKQTHAHACAHTQCESVGKLGGDGV